MISKLLIANRGEIAVRIIRTARAMGIRTVAVYSDADANALHTVLADEAVPLGDPEPAASYLDADKIIQAANDTGADAIHPGYGFLAESPDFADACFLAGITFVGPPAEAMRKLGAKIDAKQLAVQAKVPVVPGYFKHGATPATLLKEAKKIGFPVMLKASAGGGGRGMRICQEADFLAELETASAEAKSAFGDGAMMIEKLIKRPRHVEVQILADAHGNVAALFERECSIQRRHQKLIEEAPAPRLAVGSWQLAGPESQVGKPQSEIPNPESAIRNPKSAISWPALLKAAIALAKAAGYQGAGTIEFMVDDATGEFYFLEVNARLQVEHPVTEMVTGIDLVAWQLRVASGERLALSPALMEGDRSAMRGHAIEARIVAEDPEHSWLPSAGKIQGWAEPKGPGIRVDTGYGPSAEVPRHYDSLLAKVIAYGETRDQAIARLEQALLDFHILGVKTNIEHTLAVIRHPDFRAGHFDTGFLGREFADWSPDPSVPTELASILDACNIHLPAGSPHPGAGHAAGPANGSGVTSSPAWSLPDSFRNA